jgi:hypothetical protein
LFDLRQTRSQCRRSKGPRFLARSRIKGRVSRPGKNCVDHTKIETYNWFECPRWGGHGGWQGGQWRGGGWGWGGVGFGVGTGLALGLAAGPYWGGYYGPYGYGPYYGAYAHGGDRVMRRRWVVNRFGHRVWRWGPRLLLSVQTSHAFDVNTESKRPGNRSAVLFD